MHYLPQALEGPVEFQRLDVYGEGLKVLPWLARIRQHTYHLWNLFFWLTEQPWLFPILRWALTGWLLRSVRVRIRFEPDLLVATHLAGAQVLDSLSSELPGAPATLIVATDYLPHRAWLAKADGLVVAAGVPAPVFDWHAHEAANAELIEAWGCGYATRSVPSRIRILEEWTLHRDRFEGFQKAATQRTRQVFFTADTRTILDAILATKRAV
jgi:hypothetical protein